MWLITKESTGEIFPIHPNVEEYKIGRLDADLVLREDKSISATHAFLRPKASATKEKYLELEDAGSKNGTFRNEGIASRKPIPRNKSVKLNDGDRIQFGVIGNLWIISWVHYRSISSGLNPDEVKNLDHWLSKLNGQHVLKWDEKCTHFTMNEIKVTIKLMYALLSETPIVDFDYWRDVVKVSLKEKKGPLLTENYIPKVSDVLLAQQNLDFSKQFERRSIFAGKTFIFLNQKHFEIYAPIVEKAGGISRGLKDGVQKTFLVSRDVCVIQYVSSTESQSSQSTQTINSIAEYLEQNSCRFIPEYEIALAIIHCSTEKYCNPDFKIISNIISSTSTLRCSESPIVENTSAVNVELGNESYAMLVLETESSQLFEKVDKTSLVSRMYSGGSSIPNSEHLPSISNRKETNLNVHCGKKRGRSNMSGDSESFEDGVRDIKKMHIESGVDTKRTKFNNINPKISSEIKNSNRYNALDTCINKVPKHSLKSSIPNISDDEDDLFNFGDNEASTKEETLFDLENNFIENNEGNKDGNLDFVPTQAFVPKKKTYIKLFPKPKLFPQKLSSEGWLTFPCKKEYDKLLGEDVGTKHDEKVVNENSDLEAFKGGFHIKVNAVSLLSMDAPLTATSEVISSTNKSKKGANIKKFIKQKFLRQCR